MRDFLLCRRRHLVSRRHLVGLSRRQEKRHRYPKVERINDDLTKQWVAVVPEESFQQPTENALLIYYSVDVPDVLDEYIGASAILGGRVKFVRIFLRITKSRLHLAALLRWGLAANKIRIDDKQCSTFQEF